MKSLRHIAVICWLLGVVIGTRYVFGDIQVFGERQYLEYITPYLPFRHSHAAL
ncbi:MAG: hypothetical protein V1895_01340 [Parcubacteria group bacterium]